MPSALPFNGNEPLVDRSTNFPVFSRRRLLTQPRPSLFLPLSPIVTSSASSICHVHPESRLTLLPSSSSFSLQRYSKIGSTSHAINFQIYIRRPSRWWNDFAHLPIPGEERRLIVISWPGICLPGRREDGSKELLISFARRRFFLTPFFGRGIIVLGEGC